jgi:hypothetical protein
MIYAIFKDIPLRTYVPLLLAAVLFLVWLGLRTCSGISFALGTDENQASPDVHTSAPRSYDALRVPESPPGGAR